MGISLAARIAIASMPLAAGVWIAACAADPGDPSKTESLEPGTDGSKIPPGTDSGGPQLDQQSPPFGDSPSSTDMSSPPPSDSSPPPEDTSTPTDTSAPSDSPAPPTDTGPPPAGCATGATVIPMAATGSSGNFGTTGAVCVTYKGSVTGWNASNIDGRTVTAVGSTTQTPTPSGGTLPNQPGLMPGTDGYIYWNYTAGTLTYASMSTF